ncbi:MAG: DUF998 domain-containing protein [Candidatus Hodarchaeota archaeon]
MQSTSTIKASVIVAFIGFIMFMVFGTLALVLYPPIWNIFDDSFSTAGAIIPGNPGTVLMLNGLAMAGILMIPISLIYVKHYLKEGSKIKYLIIICFFMQVISRVFMIFVGLFPTKPWGSLHDNFAIVWFGGEALVTIILSFLMLGTKKTKEINKDIPLGIVYLILNAVSFFFWLPCILEIWEGMAIPELYSVGVIYSFSMILWGRAYNGKFVIGPDISKLK